MIIIQYLYVIAATHTWWGLAIPRGGSTHTASRECHIFSADRALERHDLNVGNDDPQALRELELVLEDLRAADLRGGASGDDRSVGPVRGGHPRLALEGGRQAGVHVRVPDAALRWRRERTLGVLRPARVLVEVALRAGVFLFGVQ